MSVWEIRARTKILAVRVALVGANLAFAFALLFWWKYKIKPLQYLLSLQPRAILALHFATDSLQRGKPHFKNGQYLRVLRPVDALMTVVPNFSSTVGVKLQVGDIVRCVGRTPGSHIDLSNTGNTDRFIEKSISENERQLALNELRSRNQKIAMFYLPVQKPWNPEECFAVTK